MFNQKEYKKQYYIQNKKKYAEVGRIKYIKNRKDILQRRRRNYLEETPEKREKRLAYLKAYRLKNEHVLKVNSQNYHSKYIQYGHSAKRRNHSFDLTFEEFTTLFSGACFYCGFLNSRGIDRVDNNSGYSISNSVSCCKMCNKMKWAFTQKDFIEQIKKIYKNIN